MKKISKNGKTFSKIRKNFKKWYSFFVSERIINTYTSKNSRKKMLWLAKKTVVINDQQKFKTYLTMTQIREELHYFGLKTMTY